MSDAFDVLRSYARAVARLTGAGSASLYMPAGAAGREALVHEGAVAPLPELADPDAAAAFAKAHPDVAAARMASEAAEGLLFAIPVRLASRSETPKVERRRGKRRSTCSPRSVRPSWWSLRKLDRTVSA